MPVSTTGRLDPFRSFAPAARTPQPRRPILPVAHGVAPAAREQIGQDWRSREGPGSHHGASGGAPKTAAWVGPRRRLHPLSCPGTCHLLCKGREGSRDVRHRNAAQQPPPEWEASPVHMPTLQAIWSCRIPHVVVALKVTSTWFSRPRSSSPDATSLLLPFPNPSSPISLPFCTCRRNRLEDSDLHGSCQLPRRPDIGCEILSGGWFFNSRHPPFPT